PAVVARSTVSADIQWEFLDRVILPLRLGSAQCFQVSDDVVDLCRRETVFPGWHLGGAAGQNDITESFLLIRRKISEPAAEVGPQGGNATIFAAALAGLGQVAKRTALEK